MVRLSSRKRAIGRNLGGVRVDVAAAAAARARSDASASAGARTRRVPSRSRSRARVPARPRSDARVHARAIARLKSHAGRVFDQQHAPGNHLLLAHSLHRHGALDCCRVGNRGTAVSPRSRVASEARDIERGSRFDRLRSPSSRSRRADEIVGFTGAMGLALARTGKRGAAGGDLARGHLDGGQRRRSWRRRWRPFLLLCGVRKAGSVCEYDAGPALSRGLVRASVARVSYRVR